MDERIFKLIQFLKRVANEDSFEGDLDQEELGVSDNFDVKSKDGAPSKHKKNQDKTAAAEFSQWRRKKLTTYTIDR